MGTRGAGSSSERVLLLIPRPRAVEQGLLGAYRWQYIGSGVGGRFKDVLFELIDEARAARVTRALTTLL